MEANLDWNTDKISELLQLWKKIKSFFGSIGSKSKEHVIYDVLYLFCHNKIYFLFINLIRR